MNPNEWSTDQEISEVRTQLPHIVILGAGASRAALPSGDAAGKPLPVMDDLVKATGLRKVLRQNGVDPTTYKNFEVLYSELAGAKGKKRAIKAIEDTVRAYFSDLKLPASPTIYDHLVLSLRPKDVIATFNWDPLLVQAMYRNRTKAIMPKVLFLHGCVAIGYCAKHDCRGLVGWHCRTCSARLEPTRLLFPVLEKNYTLDPYIAREWKAVRKVLSRAFVLTVFGYGAPSTDVQAVKLMKQAWKANRLHKLLLTEIIDSKSQPELERTWKGFVFSHHYEISKDFYSSWIARHPRRSCEALYNQNIEARFIDNHQLPRKKSFPALHEWLKPLLDAERRAAKG